MTESSRVALLKSLLLMVLVALALGIFYTAYIVMKGTPEILAVALPAAAVGVAICWAIWYFGIRSAKSA